MRILAEGRTTVDKIVAVTFTEKAAGELKLRLRERLDRERTSGRERATARSRLDAALTRLEEAHISTIHGFCAELLRERPVEARIDPLFEVLTEPAAARLFDDAFGRWLQEQLADPPEGVRRALRRTAFGGDDGPIDRLRNAAWELTGWRDFTGDWTRNPFDRAQEIADTVALLHEVAAFTRNPASRNDPLCTSTEPARRLSDEIALQQEFGDAGAPATSIRRLGSGPGRSVAGSGARQRPAWPRRPLQGRRPARQRARRRSSSCDRGSTGSAWTPTPISRRCCSVSCAGRSTRYEQLKTRGRRARLPRSAGAARAISCAAIRWCARGFQQRFTHIFVDEFQDTDPLQAEILLLLAADDEAETDWRRVRPVPGRLFLVGDPKQSIYRFRRADVGIYREVSQQLEAQGAQLLQLNTSFRSVPEIQACVNAAFAPVMTGDELTLQAPYVPLAPSRDALPNQPAIVVAAGAVAVRDPIRVGCRDRQVAAGRGRRDGRLDHQPERLEGHRAQRRPRRSRSRPSTSACSSAASSAGRPTSPGPTSRRSRRAAFPHVLVGGRAFHEREEIEAIRAALAAVEWPDDELSVFATLRGPFFAISDEDLLDWAYRFGRKTEKGFKRHAFHPHRIPEIFNRDTPPDVEHLRPIADALQLLKRLHRHRNSVFADSLDSARMGRRVRRAARAAARDAGACRLRAPDRRRAGARQRAARRGARAAVRARRRHLVPRLRRGAAPRPPTPRRRPRRRSSKKTATASG